MADIKQDLKALARFLNVTGVKVNVNSETKVPVLTLNGTTVRGLSSVATYLAKTAGRHDLIGGNDTGERAAVSQWLEYRVTDIDRCHAEKDASTVLKELNIYLSTRTYFLGERLTLPDLLIMYGLQSSLSSLTFQEKEKYMNVSRWFDNVQSIEGVLQKQATPVYFVKNLLYVSVQA
ncbi:eukaryotic translation elongation factor 1 epsilon-1-like [Acanthaster planci]|uniref:Eukaryotic translation elongation factor 1 epsilon-1-like n=1 Tax=Acanthaster planci TaxID=133434 RepID=A0A8B7YHE0_ACAPL|nr:eukaryotic translation elongation factor 1 epsilon-1-like [Acanthaster planci]